MTKLIGYARVSTRQQFADRNRRIFWPPVSDAMTSTLTTECPGRELHDPSSIGHSTR